VGRHPTYLSTARLGDDQLPGNLDDFQDLVVLLTGGAQKRSDRTARGSPEPLSRVASCPSSGTGTVLSLSGRSKPRAVPMSPCSSRSQAFRIKFDDVVRRQFRDEHPETLSGRRLQWIPFPIALGARDPRSGIRNAVALVDRDADGLPDRIAASNFSGNSMTLFDGGGGNPFLETSFSPVTATRAPVALAAATLDASPSPIWPCSVQERLAADLRSPQQRLLLQATPDAFPLGLGPHRDCTRRFQQRSDPRTLSRRLRCRRLGRPSTSPAFTRHDRSVLGTFGAVVGICSGGSSAGESCTSDAGCPAGTCSFSLTSAPVKWDAGRQGLLLRHRLPHRVLSPASGPHPAAGNRPVLAGHSISICWMRTLTG
jgi:hypothetical protein